MPFYEYQCSACGAQVEVLQKITDAPLKKCTECGRNQLKKLVSAPVFRLKGSGWYETDFKTDKDRKRNLVDEGGDSKESKSGDSDSGSSAAPESTSKSRARPARRASRPATASRRPAAKAKPRAKAKSGSKAGARGRK
jgi:putative FmdB family regulatory protein